MAARRRREAGRVGRRGRVHRHVRQLGDGEQLAPEPLLAAEQDTQLGVDGGLDAFVEPVAGAGRGRDGYRGAAAGGHRPEYLQDVTVEQVLRAEEHGDRPAVVEADLGRRGLRPAGRPPGPATLAVVPLDRPVLVLVLHAVMAAGRDQQRHAAGLEAHLGGEGQAGPVGPVEQPDHFWQAGHGGTIRGKSARGRRERHPVWSNYALCRPGTRTARVTALVSGAGNGS